MIRQMIGQRTACQLLAGEGASRVLDGEIMQSEALLHRAQGLIRLVQADPDEAWPFPVRRDSFSPTR